MQKTLRQILCSADTHPHLGAEARLPCDSQPSLDIRAPGGALGISFRQSAKWGPFRFTVSRRGVTVSAGTRWGRVAKGSSGVVSVVRLPGTGLSLRRRLGR